MNFAFMKSSFVTEAKSLEASLTTIQQQFGFREINKSLDALGVTIVVQNASTGVRCLFSPREGEGWMVKVVRLRDGQFPKYPIFIKPNTVLDWFDIIDVARLRIQAIPELNEIIERNLPLNAEAVVTILEKCCSDILNGNFRLFEHLDSTVKTRAVQLRQP